MSHYIEKCKCGVVLNQCRCPNPNKEQRLSTKPCTHVAQDVPMPPPIVPKPEPLSKDHLKHVDEYVALFSLASQRLKEIVKKMKESEAAISHLQKQIVVAQATHNQLEVEYKLAYTDKDKKGKDLLKAASA